LHLPPTMCATKGLAGRLEMEPISGQMPVGHLSGRDRARPEKSVGVAFCMLFLQRGRGCKTAKGAYLEISSSSNTYATC
jgi:hypothetical protein